jgi:hypothetical protein
VKLLIHGLVVLVALFGSDVILNGGTETRALWRHLDLQSALNGAKVRNYQLGASVRQELYFARPHLASVAD